MNIYIKTLAAIAILTNLTVTAGCATAGRNLVRDNTVKIEKVSSKQATITSVNVIQEGDQVMLRGEVRRRLVSRGHIPGHIDLEVIGADGSVLEESVIDYHRRSVKSRYAIFHDTLRVTPPPGSTIRVTHDTRALSPSPCERRHCNGSL